MKKILVFFLTACVCLSGCGSTESTGEEAETSAAEQLITEETTIETTTETTTEETTTETTTEETTTVQTTKETTTEQTTIETTVETTTEETTTVQTTIETTEETTTEVAIQTTKNTANLVWVPVNGGTKYHTRENCSNMENPIQVDVDTAIANGFTPCKRCH